MSAKNINYGALMGVSLLGFLTYVGLLAYLWRYYWTKVQAVTKTTLGLILGFKIVTIWVLLLYLCLIEPAFPESGDDFVAFYHMRTLSNRVIEVLYVTTLSITSHFHTKIYLTSIPLKYDTTDPHLLSN